MPPSYGAKLGKWECAAPGCKGKNPPAVTACAFCNRPASKATLQVIQAVRAAQLEQAGAPKKRPPPPVVVGTRPVRPGQANGRSGARPPKKEVEKNDRAPRTCFCCGQVGHLRAQCPQREERQQTREPAESSREDRLRALADEAATPEERDQLLALLPAEAPPRSTQPALLETETVRANTVLRKALVARDAAFTKVHACRTALETAQAEAVAREVELAAAKESARVAAKRASDALEPAAAGGTPGVSMSAIHLDSFLQDQTTLQVDLGELDDKLDGPEFSDEDRKTVADEADKARVAVQAALQAALGGLALQVEAKREAYRVAREDVRQVAKKRKGAGGEARPVAAATAVGTEGAAAGAALAGDAAGSTASSSKDGAPPLRTDPPPGTTPAAQADIGFVLAEAKRLGQQAAAAGPAAPAPAATSAPQAKKQGS